MTTVAWIYATCPVARFRDGQKALEYARKACELTDWKDANYIDTLAAAYAENEFFILAIKWQMKAIELALAENKADYRSRLKLYKSGKPSRAKPNK